MKYCPLQGGSKQNHLLRRWIIYLTFDAAKIIVIIDTEKSNLSNVSGKIQDFLKSIHYDSKVPTQTQD